MSIDVATSDLEVLVDYAEPGAALEASILNYEGVAIANATLVSAPERRLRAFTPNLPAGTYYVQVRAPSGYNDYQLTVNVLGGCVNSVTPAAAKHSHADDATSKKGQACTAAGCHLIASPGAGAPGFSFAGTVFTAADGATPKPGATIKVIAGGTTVSAVSDEDGNFYSTQTLTLPGKTLATSCPTLTPMVGQILASGGGNCNNCHVTGGTTTPIFVE